MNNKKRLEKLENQKREKLENLKLENEMLDYFNSYEYTMENQIENKELLENVISDILKFQHQMQAYTKKYRLVF